jgi:PAS domain S-box-containing protein
MSQVSSPWQPSADALEQLPVAYTEVDGEGFLRVANAAACRLLEMPASELIGRQVWEFVPSDEASADRAAFLEAMQSGGDLPVIRRSLYTPRGGFRAHELHRRLLRDQAGNPIGMASVTFDVSGPEASIRESDQTRLWLESALAAIPQSVIVTDALGFVRYSNAASEGLTGWSLHEILGLQIEEVLSILRATAKNGQPLDFRSTLDQPWHGDVEMLTRQRRPVSVWLSSSPVLDGATGYTKGVVIVLGSPRAADQAKVKSHDLDAAAQSAVTQSAVNG